jgi:hypothetical protein
MAQATDWFIVEQDTSSEPLEDVRQSFAYLREITQG